MRSIEDKLKTAKKRVGASSFANFVQAIDGGKFSKIAITRNFNRFVDKDDYAPEDKKEIIDWLVWFTNLPPPSK